MDAQVRNGKMSAKVDFTNASAEVIAELFFRIFDSYKAMYEIDDVIGSIVEKMEAGIRAFYGNKSIDKAIEQRADVELRSIIVQDATEAAIFKSWGVVIRSLAVTDIKLPEEVESERIRILQAEKSREIAAIVQDTAVIEARTSEIIGEGTGRGLKAIKTMAGRSSLTIKDVMDFDLKTKLYHAYEKAEVLIANAAPGDNSALTGATAGAAAKVGADAASSKKTPESQPES
jgi:regulator of protease activity HflC (stomatin/prohibitin superfamily)